MIILGIDPGITGAISVIETDGECFEVRDMPIMPKVSGKGSQVDSVALYDIVMCITHEYYPRLAIIETVSASPQMGVTSAFSFGKSAGIAEGVCAGRIETHHITPQRWKKSAGLIGTEKDAARLLAIQLYPEMEEYLSRKKDGGRADAMLIARYGVTHCT